MLFFIVLLDKRLIISKKEIATISEFKKYRCIHFLSINSELITAEEKFYTKYDKQKMMTHLRIY